MAKPNLPKNEVTLTGNDAQKEGTPTPASTKDVIPQIVLAKPVPVKSEAAEPPAPDVMKIRRVTFE